MFILRLEGSRVCNDCDVFHNHILVTIFKFWARHYFRHILPSRAQVTSGYFIKEYQSQHSHTVSVLELLRYHFEVKAKLCFNYTTAIEDTFEDLPNNMKYARIDKNPAPT